ncbi:cell division protein FtsQ/DivIB [Paenibacillus oceani]|uniref:FtsQ-type POTRA domain-containing protein n=1 Tax=Paenibacillus oceani TaxID=2772510 RepID=A0A927C5N5_9BACL|nr:FtsQ-type POTRA domain-containing protein [Paenibacillus oceani]MBD2861823.1 FtsQ-type POTRA domain-containing protein [Paenibacillus oceani]
MQERMPVLREEKRRPRSSRKLIVFLVLLFISLLAVLFFRSSLSKIAQIEITGNLALTTEEIGQVLSISVGDNFFPFRSASVEARVRQLQAVENVAVSKKFPGLVRVAVEEYPRVAFQINSSGGKDMLLSNGLAIPVNDPGVVVDKPILSGWSDSDPWKAKLTETLRRLSDKTLAEISEIKPSPTKTYEDKIKMYTRSQFEVYTTITYLPDKIQYLDEMIEQVAEKDVSSGVFELLEANTHIPFDMYYTQPQDPAKEADKKSGSASNTTKNDTKDPQKKGN